MRCDTEARVKNRLFQGYLGRASLKFDKNLKMGIWFREMFVFVSGLAEFFLGGCGVHGSKLLSLRHGASTRSVVKGRDLTKMSHEKVLHEIH